MNPVQLHGSPHHAVPGISMHIQVRQDLLTGFVVQCDGVAHISPQDGFHLLLQVSFSYYLSLLVYVQHGEFNCN